MGIFPIVRSLHEPSMFQSKKNQLNTEVKCYCSVKRPSSPPPPIPVTWVSTDVQRCRVDTLGKLTSAHCVVCWGSHRAVGESNCPIDTAAIPITARGHCIRAMVGYQAAESSFEDHVNNLESHPGLIHPPPGGSMKCPQVVGGIAAVVIKLSDSLLRAQPPPTGGRRPLLSGVEFG